MVTSDLVSGQATSTSILFWSGVLIFFLHSGISLLYQTWMLAYFKFLHYLFLIYCGLHGVVTCFSLLRFPGGILFETPYFYASIGLGVVAVGALCVSFLVRNTHWLFFLYPILIGFLSLMRQSLGVELAKETWVISQFEFFASLFHLGVLSSLLLVVPLVFAWKVRMRTSSDSFLLFYSFVSLLLWGLLYTVDPKFFFSGATPRYTLILPALTTSRLLFETIAEVLRVRGTWSYLFLRDQNELVTSRRMFGRFLFLGEWLSFVIAAFIFLKQPNNGFFNHIFYVHVAFGLSLFVVLLVREGFERRMPSSLEIKGLGQHLLSISLVLSILHLILRSGQEWFEHGYLFLSDSTLWPALFVSSGVFLIWFLEYDRPRFTLIGQLMVGLFSLVFFLSFT